MMMPNYDQWKLTAPGDEGGAVDIDDAIPAIEADYAIELADAWAMFLEIQNRVHDELGYRHYSDTDFLAACEANYTALHAERDKKNAEWMRDIIIKQHEDRQAIIDATNKRHPNRSDG